LPSYDARIGRCTFVTPAETDPCPPGSVRSGAACVAVRSAPCPAHTSPHDIGQANRLCILDAGCVWNAMAGRALCSEEGDTRPTLCPVRQWQDGQLCRQCHETCLSCDNAHSDGCTTCSKPLFHTDGRCVATCPQRTFTSAAGGYRECIACSFRCADCVSAGESSPASTCMFAQHNHLSRAFVVHV